MKCPECHNEVEKMVVTAPATVETLQLVNTAEIVLSDFAEQARLSATGLYLPIFPLEDRLETLDGELDCHTLEVADPRSEFHCVECNALLSREEILGLVTQGEAVRP